MTRVGVIGLGRMGAPMASNLASAGFDLAVWNRSADKARALADAIGATAVLTPATLAAVSDVVVTMLADDAASAEVLTGADGVFASAEGADHILVMGTHSVQHVRDMAELAGDRTVIDAPVSGSVDAARDARLMVMAGASEDTCAAVRPVLDAVSADIVWLGSVGAGATTKLAVNMLIHGLNQTLAEALALTSAAGIAAEDAYAAIERSAAAAPMVGYRKPQYLRPESSPVSFALSLARKDVGLAVTLASELGVRLPQTELNLAQLGAAEAAGLGDRDMASLRQYLADPDQATTR